MPLLDYETHSDLNGSNDNHHPHSCISNIDPASSTTST